VERPLGLAKGAAWLVEAVTVGLNLTPGDLGLLLLLLPAAGDALVAAAARLLPAGKHTETHKNAATQGV
jgi:hypothetical protein